VYNFEKCGSSRVRLVKSLIYGECICEKQEFSRRILAEYNSWEV